MNGTVLRPEILKIYKHFLPQINLTKNAASQAKPEAFSFSERLTKTIKLTILTLHDGTTGHGYKSIEVTNGMASNGK